MRPAEELRYLILAAQREGNRQLAHALRPLGVTPSQAEVLRLLAEHAPLSLMQLGELLVCEAGTNPSRLVSSMVQAGMVHRVTAPEDRRAIKLTLTDRGQETAAQVEQVEAALYAMLDASTAGFDRDSLIRWLGGLVANQPSGEAIERRKNPGTHYATS